jgi:hypothetical protein
MNNINIIILNQWNLDLNSTIMEEDVTADDSTLWSGDLASFFNLDLKRRFTILVPGRHFVSPCILVKLATYKLSWSALTG